MNLSPYVETVRAGVVSAAALADDQTREIANRLGAAIDSATRLALIEVLSDAAAVVSADIAPASVDVRMVGNEPELLVTMPPPGGEPTRLTPPAEAPAPGSDPEGDTDEPLARISLRLPAPLKARVDELAGREGVSTNAWLIRAIADAVSGRRHGFPPPPPPTPAPGFFGEHGPFGPQGIFGPHGPFGHAHPAGTPPHPPQPPQAPTAPPAPVAAPNQSGHGVQGWAR